MSLVFSILAWLGIVLGGLVLLALLMPIGLRARGRLEGFFASGRAAVHWGFGIFSVVFDSDQGARLLLFGWSVLDLSADRPRKTDRKAERPEPKTGRSERRGPGGGSAAWYFRHRRVLFGMLKRIIRSLHIRGALRGTVGLGDPAETAWLWILLSQLPDSVAGFDVSLDCDYLEPVLELRGDVRVRIWPLQVVWVMLVMLLKRETRQILKAVA